MSLRCGGIFNNPYLALPSGRAGYYTCLALRPYQFSPMRNLEVADCEVVVGVEAESLPATWHW